MPRNPSPVTQNRAEFRFRADERVAGVYILQEPIGSGAFAEVWKATDTSMNREVALKLFYEDIMARTDLAEGVQREAKSQARVVHQRVVAIYSCHLDISSGPGPYYIAMRLMQGGTLDDLLKRESRLSVSRSVSIARDVTEGLQAAHDEDIVHRDIKPNNVLLDSRGRAALGDFGIAKDLRSKRGQSVFGRPGIGTAHYMCPEQHMGKAVTKSWDIYSTGILLYEMLTGDPPFAALNDLALYKAKTEQPIPPLKLIVPDIPPRLQLVVDRCIDPDNTSRYEDCAALLRALDWAFEEPTKPKTNPKFVAVEDAEPPEAAVKAFKAETGTRIGNYQLEALIGEGPQARVWRAAEVNGKATLAVKIFNDPLTGKRADQCLSALRLQAKIVDTRVAPILAFDLGNAENTSPSYIAMRFFPGGSLRQTLSMGHHFEAAGAVRILRDIIDGIRAAHALGLIHGNLKPSNVLLDSNGRATISDFGIDTSPTDGNHQYASPEQKNGTAPRQTADIYSMGVLLHEMLVGRLPEFSSTPGQSVLGLLAEGVPERLEKVICCCLDTNLEHRYANCETLLRALDWAAASDAGSQTGVASATGPSPKPPAAESSNTVLWVILGLIAVCLVVAAIVVLAGGGN